MQPTELVTSEDRLRFWTGLIARQKIAVFDTETTSVDPMSAELVGLVFACKDEGQIKSCYIPVAHKTKRQLSLDVVRNHVSHLFTYDRPKWVAHNTVYDNIILARHGFGVPTDPHDTMLMSYALDGKTHAHSFDDLCELHFEHRSIKFGEAVPQHRFLTLPHFGHVRTDHAAAYAGEDGVYTLKLFYRLRRRLKEEGLWNVYNIIDRPIIAPLVEMKMAGVKVSRKKLWALTQEFQAKMDKAERYVKKRFPGTDIASPHQVGKLLYDELQLDAPKYTKTGKESTAKKVIELLEDEHPVVPKILQYRKYAKLISTYTVKLPDRINEETGRIHCNIIPIATNTARFASSDPNLQNIPIDGPEGKAIRNAFIAEKGYKLISADYSQIELRVQAHRANEKSMIKAFAAGVDQHAATVKDMMGLTEADFTDPDEWKDTRKKGKTLNFGVIFGQTEHGLSFELKIPQDEALELIERYFSVRPGTRKAIDEEIEFLHEHGYNETLYGRRVYQKLTGVGWKDAHAERAGFNAVIQGSAADLIRQAMPLVRSELRGAGLKHTTMLLQVHDELLFKSKEEEADEACKVIKAGMESAGGKWIKWRVPIVCEAKQGGSWGEAH